MATKSTCLFGHFSQQPMKIVCDSQVTLHIPKNLIFHELKKHIELDCHFIREKVVASLLTLMHLTSQHQLADIFTKALEKRQF